MTTTDKKAHIVSIGLEQRRVSTQIPRIGADKVVIIYFNTSEKNMTQGSFRGFEKSLVSRLEDNRTRFKARMEEIGYQVEEVPIESFEIKEMCIKLNDVIKKLESEGYNSINVSLSTGHTTFKIAAYIISCYYSSVTVWYGFTHDYLDDKVNTLLDKYKIWITSSEKVDIPGDLKENLKEIYEFVQEGHTGQTKNVVRIPKMPLPELVDSERWILELIHRNGGNILSTKFIAEQILDARPKCFHHHLKTKVKDKIRALSQQLGKQELYDLEKKGYIHKEKRGNRQAVSITDAGSTVIDFVKEMVSTGQSKISLGSND